MLIAVVVVVVAVVDADNVDDVDVEGSVLTMKIISICSRNSKEQTKLILL